MAYKLAEAFVNITTRDKSGPGMAAAKRNVSASIGGIASIISSGIAGAVGAGIAKVALGFAAAAEQSKIAFEVILKDGAKATKLLKELKQFSDVTPFEAKDVVAAGRSLLAFGSAAEDVSDQLGFLGDIAAGGGGEGGIAGLARIFNKIRAEGKLTGETMDQLGDRAVDVKGVLGEMLGKSGEEMNKMQRDGEISFSMVEKAMRSMTEEGGRFFGAMEKQSKSYSGLMSTAASRITDLKVALGNTLLPAAKAVLTAFNALVGGIVKFNEASGGAVGRLMAISVAVSMVTGALYASIVAWKALGVTATQVIRKILIFSGIGIPVLILVTIIWGLVEAFVALGKKMSLNQEVMDTWSGAMEKFKLAWENIKVAFTAAWNALQEAAVNALNSILGVFGWSMESIEGGLVGMITTGIEKFAEFVLSASEWLRVLAENSGIAWQLIKQQFLVNMLFMKDMIMHLPMLWAWSWGVIVRGVIEFGKLLLKAIGVILKGVWFVIKNTFLGIWNFIKGLFTGKKFSMNIGKMVENVLRQVSKGAQAGLHLRLPPIALGEDTKAAMAERDKLLDKLREEKDLLEAGREARLADEEEKAEAAEEGEKKKDTATVVAKVEIPKGSFGFTELNRAFQDSQLKALDAAKKTEVNTAKTAAGVAELVREAKSGTAPIAEVATS
jgi:tape measure domain-containing protein